MILTIQLSFAQGLGWDQLLYALTATSEFSLG